MMHLAPSCRAPPGSWALGALLWAVAGVWGCAPDEAPLSATIRLQTTLRPLEELSHVRLRMSAGEPRETFYDETWRVGGSDLPELPATVTVKQGRADAIFVIADALFDDFLIDRQEGELIFSDPVRGQLTLELGPRFLCGNGVVDDGEECDCGEGAAASASCSLHNSDVAPDACRTDCRQARCGDGVVDTGEACDDGNEVDEDPCTSSCEVNVCGDGIPRPRRACWSRSQEPPLELMPFPAVAAVRDLDDDGLPEVLVQSELGNYGVLVFGQEVGEGLRLRDTIMPSAQIRAVYPGKLDDSPGLDLVVLTNPPAEVRIYARTSGATFSETPTQRLLFGDTRIGAAAAGHLDEDAYLDLVVTTGNELWLLGGDGVGGVVPFASAPMKLHTPAMYLAMQDVNGDARTDVLVVPQLSPELWLLPGDGRGGVGSKARIPLGAVPRRLLVGSLDQDADPDLLFIDELFRLWLYRGQGRGRFAPSAWSPLSLSLQPTHIAIGDVDSDGWMDLVLFEAKLGQANGVSIAFAVGQPEVAPAPTMFEGFSHTIGPPALDDIDGDLDLDLLIPEHDLFAGFPLHVLHNEP